MTEIEIKNRYTLLYSEVLIELAKQLEIDFNSILCDLKNIDRVSARAKTPSSFLKKALKIEDGKLKYSDPFSEIQDMVGIRIITFYINDIDLIAEKINSQYRHIEEKDRKPESVSEFGYTGKHFILLYPPGMIKNNKKDIIPPYFELQIKTLFQHAFSEASHDLAYKPNAILTTEQKRKIAFTAAQSWGADLIFSELFKELGNSHV